MPSQAQPRAAMPVAFRSFLKLSKEPKSRSISSAILHRWLAVAAEDVEIELVVLQSAEGEREVHLDVADLGRDLVGHLGIGRIRRAERFPSLEQGVRFVDVTGVELQVLLVGLVGDFAGLPFTLARRASCLFSYLWAI